MKIALVVENLSPSLLEGISFVFFLPRNTSNVSFCSLRLSLLRLKGQGKRIKTAPFYSFKVNTVSYEMRKEEEKLHVDQL